MSYIYSRVHKRGGIHTVEYIIGECLHGRTYMRENIHIVEGRHGGGYTQ